MQMKPTKTKSPHTQRLKLCNSLEDIKKNLAVKKKKAKKTSRRKNKGKKNTF